MYNSFANQIYHLIHYAISYALLFILMPKIIFFQNKTDQLENFFANFAKMVLLLTGIGYLLIILKLYEVLAFVIIFIIFLLFRWQRTHQHAVPSTWIAYIFDLFDGQIHFQMKKLPLFMNTFSKRTCAATLTKLRPLPAESFLLLVILAISAYLRFPDALINPVPAMSDGYVTLAWLKYINERILFHDGIYPQALYFYMAAISKFAFINPLYILKYTGPLDTLLIVLGLYFGVSRMLDDKFAGLIAALVYGIVGQALLEGDWARQAATNSQEFGLIFIAPGLYFLLAYLKEGKKNDFWAGLASIFVVGLTHPMAYVLMVIGGGSVILSALPQWKRNRRVFHLIVMGMAAGIAAILPIGVGFLYRIPFNSSGARFATLYQSVPWPALSPWDIAAVAANLSLFLLAIVQTLRKKVMVTWFSIAWFGLFTFILYYAGGPITRNVVLISRTLDLWAIVVPILLAALINALIITYNEETLSAKITIPASLLAIAASVAYIPPQPIVPYKMQWNDDADVYLTINISYRYQGYLIVAPSINYALVLGTGYHLGLTAFLNTFDPTLPPLTIYGQHQIDENIPQDVFIYEEKQIFTVAKSNSIYSLELPVYRQEMQNVAKLKVWIATFQKHHPHSLEVFYQSPRLVVYHIH